LLGIKAQAGHGPRLKNVLTAIKSLFWVVLAGKRGLWRREKTLYFALFHVLMVFYICKLLSGRIFWKICPFKKNRAKKPTVGFCFSAGSGNMVA